MKKLTRRKLKTIEPARPPQPSTAQLAIGAPKVDTFARDTVPNVVYTIKPRGR